MNIKINLTWRIWMLVILLALSLISIFGFPPIAFQDGILIIGVEKNSVAYEEGLRQDQIIVAVDRQNIENVEDYLELMQGKFISDEKLKIIIQTQEKEFILFLNNSPRITISEIPNTNLQTGLDISGGSRALIKAQEIDLTSADAEDLSKIIENRLNVYGIDDVKVSPISDLSDNYYVRVEIAGTTPEDVKNLISQQGKFEAKIGNETVFTGGNDITSVARSGFNVGVESCQESQGTYFCNFAFTIFLSKEAAERHADITKDLELNLTTTGRYLSENLDLFLDDKLVDSLLISESLKGIVTTQISISGSGTGFTEEEAFKDAQSEMNNLQTILITGSLPFKLEIVKLDTISPSFGEKFVDSIFLAGIAAIFTVSLFIFIRYRSLKSSFALLFVSISEIIIVLGIASLIRWNLDLPSIAGILAIIGIGIDQQIIILDESKEKLYSLAQRLKRAYGIILGAYFTAVVALIPLFFTVAGFFKGFALTTIIGITVGVLITRPAFSDIIKKIEE